MKKIICLSILLCISIYSNAQDYLPNLKLPTLDGNDVLIQDISKDDQLVIISLWATWCVPCKNELDAINEVYDDWTSETNVKFY